MQCSNDSIVLAKPYTRKAHHTSQTDIRYTEDIFRLDIHQILWLLLCSCYPTSARSQDQSLGVSGTGAI